MSLTGVQVRFAEDYTYPPAVRPPVLRWQYFMHAIYAHRDNGHTGLFSDERNTALEGAHPAVAAHAPFREDKYPESRIEKLTGILKAGTKCSSLGKREGLKEKGQHAVAHLMPKPFKTAVDLPKLSVSPLPAALLCRLAPLLRPPAQVLEVGMKSVQTYCRGDEFPVPAGKGEQDGQGVQIGLMVGTEYNGFLQLLHVLEAVHLDSAEQAKQGENDTIHQHTAEQAHRDSPCPSGHGGGVAP